MTEIEILSAIGSTEPSRFNEFCRELPDCPERGDGEAWSALFNQIHRLERHGDIEVERIAQKIDTLILTEQGAARVKSHRWK